MKKNITYAGTGVDYDGGLDLFKRAAQQAGRATTRNIARLNNGEFREVEASRGESVFLIEAAKSYFAQVEEGLGSKNLVADAMYYLTNKTYYDQIAQCTVATIANDMATAGAALLSLAMHMAVGDSNWFKNQRRYNDLIDGWRQACNLARCIWGPGETPTLKGIVVPGTVVLSGSAMGLVKPKERLITADKIRHGDAIVFIESNGIHANGLTLTRSMADRQDGFWRRVGHLFLPERFSLQALPKGYLTELSDGRTYGDTLLDPTHIYIGLVQDCLDHGVDIHYAVNVSGHGWRKLMRAPQLFAYVIDRLPRPQPLFDFIQERGPVDDREAYGNLNMGAGFALFVAEAHVAVVQEVARSLGFTAFKAGYIEASDQKKVVIRPKSLEYGGETLDIR